MSIEGLGRKFQEARKARNLSLEEAARLTRIRQSRLAEIEADDFSNFPSLKSTFRPTSMLLRPPALLRSMAIPICKTRRRPRHRADTGRHAEPKMLGLRWSLS